MMRPSERACQCERKIRSRGRRKRRGRGARPGPGFSRRGPSRRVQDPMHPKSMGPRLMAQKLMGPRTNGAQKLMGAGVATSPHCPGFNCLTPKGRTLVAGRFGSPAEALLLRRVPFRETSARGLPSCWTSKKLGSGFPSHFFFDRPTSRFLDIDPEGSPPHPRW